MPSLIIKTLSNIFNNYLGQNKNNAVLKLAVWIKVMGYFKSVNFVFLDVGHTKHAADHRFNSLKNEYPKDNIFKMEKLLEALNVSESVTVVPASLDDFWDYDGLLNNVYKDISGKVQIIHIFSCNSENPLTMALNLWKSNLVEHTVNDHNELKVRAQRFNGPGRSLFAFRAVFEGVKCMGLNPYKVVEMWKNYLPMHCLSHQRRLFVNVLVPSD